MSDFLVRVDKGELIGLIDAYMITNSLFNYPLIQNVCCKREGDMGDYYEFDHDKLAELPDDDLLKVYSILQEEYSD